MNCLGVGLLVSFLASPAGQNPPQPPHSMTKMVVRLTGPRIKAGSFAALPKTIYRAGEQYARIEDPPDARQHLQKLTIIAGKDAFSINLIDKTGTRATETGSRHDLRLPIVLPFDPNHTLGKLDGIEFGSEVEFFEAAGARPEAGPVINAKPTQAYVLATAQGPAQLVVRSEPHTPVFLTWPGDGGSYRYEYITYEDVPFESKLFAKPAGIRWKEIPPDPDAGAPGR